MPKLIDTQSNQPLDIDLHCVSCTYNLRTLTPSQPCPECGHPIYQTIDQLNQKPIPPLNLTPTPKLKTISRILLKITITIIIVLILQIAHAFLNWQLHNYYFTRHLDVIYNALHEIFGYSAINLLFPPHKAAQFFSTLPLIYLLVIFYNLINTRPANRSRFFLKTWIFIAIPLLIIYLTPLKTRYASTNGLIYCTRIASYASALYLTLFLYLWHCAKYAFTHKKNSHTKPLIFFACFTLTIYLLQLACLAFSQYYFHTYGSPAVNNRIVLIPNYITILFNFTNNYSSFTISILTIIVLTFTLIPTHSLRRNINQIIQQSN
ncbi:hypothetical protein JD969_12185 [Planctomycetota bacterium]|nr:hypothetical protein JD969_12185 [Planctomycetota bacterium]